MVILAQTGIKKINNFFLRIDCGRVRDLPFNRMSYSTVCLIIFSLLFHAGLKIGGSVELKNEVPELSKQIICLYQFYVPRLTDVIIVCDLINHYYPSLTFNKIK